MFITDAVKTISDQFLDLGRNKLATTYPRDFEVYMCALELTNYDGETIDYFSFPVMPTSISKTESESTTVQHSLSGTTVFNKDGYTPNELTLQGNFGRTFKAVFDDDSTIKFKAINFSMKEGKYSFSDLYNDSVVKVRELPFGVKTGFSCIKILQSIIDKAKGYDEAGRSFKLLFYNSALGENYLVVPTKTPLELSQNEGTSNMIWNYTMNLTIIADLSNVSFTNNKKNQEEMLNVNNVQKTISSSIKITHKYTQAINTGVKTVSTNIVGGAW